MPRSARTVEAASGERGLKKKLVGLKTYPVALIANGLNPLRLLRSCWSGAVLDELRNGPLDKHGVGSRILDATAHVDEAEIERLAGFGRDCRDPSGGTERGLTAREITTYMNANFERAKGHRRWFDRLLMNGEWPVLLNIMGKGEGEATLPQRGGGPDPVRRAAAARADRRASCVTAGIGAKPRLLACSAKSRSG